MHSVCRVVICSVKEIKNSGHQCGGRFRIKLIGVINATTTNKIINGDSIEAMKTLSASSVELILCDLPYGTTACTWDKCIPMSDLWEQYKRVIKDNGAILLFAQQPFATDLINAGRTIFRHEIVWEKSRATGFLNANKMPLRAHELILVFYKNYLHIIHSLAKVSLT